MRNKINIILAMIIMTICSCGLAVRDINNNTIAPSKGVNVHAPGFYGSTPVRGISYLNHPYDENVGAYGYVLIDYPDNNDPANDDRIKTLAKTYFNKYPTYDYAKKQIPSKDLLVTYWLLNEPVSTPVRSAADLVMYYDFKRASLMISAIHRGGKNGPFLIAWKKPFQELDQASMKDCLLLDLSNYSKDDMAEALKIWRDMLSDTNSWNSFGNALKKMEQELKNLIEKYGPCLYNDIKDKKS